MTDRGYFGIAMYHPKTIHNLGTLWRSAHTFDAKFLATIGCRYHHQASDTMKTPKHVPLFHYDTVELFLDMLPSDCQKVAVEVGGRNICGWSHPERAVYILGPEDGSLPESILRRCQSTVAIPSSHCLNVAVAGSVVMYDRIAKTSPRTREQPKEAHDQ